VFCAEKPEAGRIKKSHFTHVEKHYFRIAARFLEGGLETPRVFFTADKRGRNKIKKGLLD
jgi:hypothetical protein